MEILVGHTGFVGGNIAAKHRFDLLCNSKNISEAFDTNPSLLVYAGVPAEMFLANNNPEADRQTTLAAYDNIRKINPERVVLISTIAVLDKPIDADEDTKISESNITAYGLNRLELERSVSKLFPNSHVIRLPALFGKGIKKNFIYDIINFFPTMLSQDKYDEFSKIEPIITENYTLQNNGYYKLDQRDHRNVELKEAFKRLGFSALNFTDSRSEFQFYNLDYLWSHIETVISNQLPLVHTAVEPLAASEVYSYITNNEFENILSKPPFTYDYKTKYANLFGGEDGYIFNKDQVLSEIKDFVVNSSEGALPG